MNQKIKSILNFIEKAPNLSVEEKNLIREAMREADNGLIISENNAPKGGKVNKGTALILQSIVEELEEKNKTIERYAREAKIETALERVRSRTMAMHKSEELQLAANLLFTQIQSLGIPAWSCGYNIWEKGDKECTGWMSSEGLLQPSFKIPLRESQSFKRFVDSKDKGEIFYVEEIGGEALSAHYAFMLTLPDFAAIAEKHIKAGYSLPTFQINNVVNFKHGNLIFITSIPVPEAHDVFKRFAIVFEQTYTRFLDLQKAETQTREAQIEAALEKIRSKSLAMQHSDELEQVAASLFDRLVELGLSFDGVLIFLFDKEKRNIHLWIATGQLPVPVKIDLPYDEEIEKNAIIEDIWRATENGGHFLNRIYSGQVKNDYFRYVQKYNGSKIPEPVKQLQIEREAWTFSCAGEKNSVIGFDSWSGQVSTEEELQILIKFGRVFEQAYTRFLDLQKAEAQAREAQIELALERVRARAMAMQKSSELAEAAQLLYYEFGKLGIYTFTCGYQFIKEENNTQTAWVVLPDGTLLPDFIDFPLTGDSVLDNRYKAWLEKKPLYVCAIQGEENKAHHRFLSQHVPSFVVVDIFSRIPDRIFFYCANFSSGYLFIIASESLSAEEEQTIIRFAKVFEMTYTRFLDLQKAEAQTREAQIEAALEKIRSRSLAMHQSQELREVISNFFERLIELEVLLGTVSIQLYDQHGRPSVFWVANAIQDPQMVLLPYGDNINQEDNYLGDGWKAMVEQKDIINKVYSKEQKDRFFEHLFTNNDLTQIPEKAREVLRKMDSHVICLFPNKNSGLFVDSWDGKIYSEESILILRRAGKVFEQAYIRFLDLQKAEAHAREAQIEAALERFRSRAMAMHKSAEIPEVVHTMYGQMKQLGFDYGAITIMIMDQEKGDMDWWMAGFEEGKFPQPYRIAYFDHPVQKQILEDWKSGKDISIISVRGEFKKTYDEELFTRNGYKVLPDKVKEWMRQRESVDFTLTYLKHGALHWGPDLLSEEQETIMQRFAKVFEQIYTRFLDLQKAEAQASEATKQASLDRVRGVIASMRSAADLELITPLIFNELTILGVPFIRCGVFVIHEMEEIVEAYLSSPDGNSLGVLRLPYHSSELTSLTVDAWRKGLVYRQHWNKADFVQWIELMMEKDQIQDKKAYQGEAALPESLNLHFVPFAQGMLYVGSTHSLQDTEIDLVKALAEAFAIAYARYEDFVRLEKAKESIEVALSELKATQAQLVQQEKLASLGQLTAGIAHEIQNPLNFVNNFSEVSEELVGELQAELDAGAVAEARSIAADLRQNLQKIHHHGQRADAIVKNMLEHSRSTAGEKQLTNLNALAEEYLRLAYHGLRAKDKSFNCTLNTFYDLKLEQVEVVPQELGRVLLNLYNNAFYAVQQKAKLVQAGENSEEEAYTQTVTVSTHQREGQVEIRVRDNGMGMPENVKSKIFQPFFTTKPTGQGTGLGLSLSYDIITKGHGGELRVESREGEYTEFIIYIPTPAAAAA